MAQCKATSWPEFEPRGFWFCFFNVVCCLHANTHKHFYAGPAGFSFFLFLPIAVFASFTIYNALSSSLLHCFIALFFPSLAQLCSKCFCFRFICGIPLVIILIEFVFYTDNCAIDWNLYVTVKLQVPIKIVLPKLHSLPLSLCISLSIWSCSPWLN